jgi:Protein of unknown function (DUF2891)
MTETSLTEAQARRFAAIALGHVTREWPNKLDHVLEGPADLLSPRALHPVFHGSFDWHSCVHGTWMLARLLRRFPAMPEAAAIRALFDAQLAPENIAAECAYLARPLARGFERPYGWAWLLELAAELDGTPWSAALDPLAQAFAARFREFLPCADYPVRAGTHGNTAFALTLAADWAEGRDPTLLALLRDRALAWYAEDADCQAWEPSGDDFLSPALAEALCMRRLLPKAEASDWLDRFLPGLAAGHPASLFRPVRVSDRTDGRIVHLDGVNLSRAWAWRSLAAGWAAADPRRAPAATAAEAHLAASLPHVAGDYMGEHWLASFAVLALEAPAVQQSAQALPAGAPSG